MSELYQLYAIEVCLNEAVQHLQAQQDLLADQYLQRRPALEGLHSNARRLFDELEQRREYFVEMFVNAEM